MKYRHSFHAGNFADVHKHVALLALIAALQRKDKGFLLLDTHGGRGCYDLSSPNPEAAAGIARLDLAGFEAEELRAYAAALARVRAALKHRHLYGGSPLLALAALRPQDRAVFIEFQGGEAHELTASVHAFRAAHPEGCASAQVERGDGYARAKAWLPPRERRGLTFIDPPYEETAGDFAAVRAALADALRRFPTGVYAAWYPVKEAHAAAAWVRSCAQALPAPLAAAQLWLYRRDSRVGLNGSGLLIANPPHQVPERMQVWQRELLRGLGGGADSGSSVELVSESHPP